MKTEFSRNDFYNLKYEPISRKDYLKHINFERKKLKFYIDILTKELNLLLNKKYSKNFWSTILDFFLLYHISICRGYYFSINKLRKKKSIYCFKILNPKYYYSPKDIQDYRNFFQKSALGDEQFFSFFIIFFFKKSKLKLFYQKKKKPNKIYEKEEKNFDFMFYKRLINKVLKYIIKPKAIVTGCYWKETDKIDITFNSKGKIVCSNFFIPSNNEKYNYNLRKKFLNNIFRNNIKRISKFDKFFFDTLIRSMPISLLENLNYKINFTENFFSQNKNIKVIINENLSQDNLLLIAIGRLRSIRTFYTEHNGLQVQNLGNIISLIKDKFDKYFTLGWKHKNNFFIPAGSNFAWSNNIFYKDYHQKYLFISGLPELNPPHLRSSYSDCGVFNSNKWYSNNITFFKFLSKLAKEKLVFKEYPNVLNNLVHKNYKDFINFITVDEKIKLLKTNKINITPGIISSAKLVIINYLSTAYLQSLISNTPTIIFCNYQNTYLTKNFNNFYYDLLKANILHKNGYSAAKFINKLVNNNEIDKWWKNEITQGARKLFLKKNLNLSLNLSDILNKEVNNLR
jgi:putative transferase (TIGR04331 family)